MVFTRRHTRLRVYDAAMPRPVSGNARENIVSTRLSDAEYDAIIATGLSRSAWLRKAVRATLGIAPMGTKLPPLVESAAEAKGPTSPLPTPARRQATAARKPEATEPRPEPPPHRHVRVRTGDHWVGGTNVGEFKCKTCDVVMGVLQ